MYSEYTLIKKKKQLQLKSHEVNDILLGSAMLNHSQEQHNNSEMKGVE